MGFFTWWKDFLRRLEEANRKQFGDGKGLDCCNLPGKRPSQAGSGCHAHSLHDTAACGTASSPHPDNDSY